jgi:hypothetical protein
MLSDLICMFDKGTIVANQSAHMVLGPRMLTCDYQVVAAKNTRELEEKLEAEKQKSVKSLLHQKGMYPTFIGLLVRT